MSNLYLPRYRELHAEVGVRAGVRAAYKIQVCRHGQVIREPFGDNFIPNLITNNGLDQLLQGIDCLPFMQACRAGSGTNPPTTGDTALQTLLKSTQTLLGSGNATSFDTVNGATTHTKVYEFAAEVGTVTYNEVGLSNSFSGTTITTRALLPSSATCNSGDNLRVTYNVTFSIPSIITPITVSLSAVGGFNISGSMKAVGTFPNIFGQLAASGGSSGGGLWPTMFASAVGQATLGSAPTTFPSVNANPVMTLLGSGVTSTLGGYTAGTFTRNATYVWATSNPASTVANVNNIDFYFSGVGTGPGVLLILTSAQTKANTNTLTVTYSGTMARV